MIACYGNDTYAVCERAGIDMNQVVDVCAGLKAVYNETCMPSNAEKPFSMGLDWFDQALNIRPAGEDHTSVMDSQDCNDTMIAFTSVPQFMVAVQTIT